MAVGYIRNDTSNNIANGNVINASDLDGEFDAVQAAMNATTGHNHDGTTGGGAPVSILGPTQDVVITASVIRPKTDNTVDLGTSALEFKDLWLTGTANIDSLVADTADINAGTIDGTTIATSDITVGAGKTLNVSAGTLTLADNQISGDKVEGGTINAITINTLTSTTGNITSVNATTVDTANIEVTTLKARDGTSAGSIADITGVVTLASSVLTTTSISGGTITGITDLAIADGGTGASTASGARTNLGLGNMATQDAASVAITGGSVSGITDLAVADGGTGASTLTGYVKGNGTTAMTASATIPNTDISGLGTMSTQGAASVAITGGSITGITDLAVADGGTGASTLTGYVKGNGTTAMTASATIPNTDISGLGTIATQDAATVALTGGTINGTSVGATTRSTGAFTTLAVSSSVTEAVFAVTGTTPALNPANGTIQTWTLTANSTPTDSFSAGQSVTLMIDDGTAFTITWPSVTWKTDSGTAPTLNTTGFTAIVLWKVGTTLYGARVGNA